MFHFWFNTYFIKEEEKVNLLNGTNSSQSNSATNSTLATPHSQFHRPLVPSLSSSLPTSLLTLQQHSLLSQTASYHSHTDKRHFSGGQPKSVLSYSQQQQQQQHHHTPHIQGSQTQHSHHASSGGALLGVSGQDYQHLQRVPGCTTAAHANRHLNERPTEKMETCRTLTLGKMDIDKANKDKQHKFFQKSFTVRKKKNFFLAARLKAEWSVCDSTCRPRYGCRRGQHPSPSVLLEQG